MTLGQTQRAFTRLVGLLIAQAYKMGYEVTLGDAFRDSRVFGMVGVKKGYGNRNSNHKRRLAIDLNLFKDGEYLDASEDHRPLGEWWENLGEKEGVPTVWGGRFNDGNHYSCEYNGQK